MSGEAPPAARRDRDLQVTQALERGAQRLVEVGVRERVPVLLRAARDDALALVTISAISP